MNLSTQQNTACIVNPYAEKKGSGVALERSRLAIDRSNPGKAAHFERHAAR